MGEGKHMAIRKRFLLTAGALSLWANTCFPFTAMTGFLHTVHVDHNSNTAHVYFEGPLTINEPGCPTQWTGNSLDDTKFMTFTYPLLVVAAAKRIQVNIWVGGCLNGYPKINAVDLIPR